MIGQLQEALDLLPAGQTVAKVELRPDIFTAIHTEQGRYLFFLQKKTGEWALALDKEAVA